MQQKQLEVLVIGAGGREHALVQACRRSPLVKSVIAAPGNGGMEAEVPCFPLNAENPQEVLALAQAQNINFAIIGPEAPLAAGVADVLRAAGIDVYGPNADGAQLEASKAYCKAFLAKYNIPTAAYQHFDAFEPAVASLSDRAFPLVVKASGLAAGKGVIICENRQTAEQALRDMLVDQKFGDSGNEVVIEDFLDGEEASLMVLISGDRYVCLPPSQDHKRIGEGDTGPNTGGMGAYAPTAVVTSDIMRDIEKSIIEPTIRGFHAEGIDFRGTLFVGLMIGPGGTKVLEYNVRFGDPECQVLLPLCATDPVSLMHDCATGTLQPAEVKLHDGFATIVVMAAKGYPEAYAKGEPIDIPASLPENVAIIHAGTRRDADGTIRSNGGRVLGVVARANTLETATAQAYAAVDKIGWPNACFRRDIGWRQLKRG